MPRVANEACGPNISLAGAIHPRFEDISPRRVRPGGILDGAGCISRDIADGLALWGAEERRTPDPGDQGSADKEPDVITGRDVHSS
jgi:hypothetical protein